MELNVRSEERYTCEFCNDDIPALTKKLQQHPTARLWMKHGQCCAACTSASDINGTYRLISSREFNNSPSPERKGKRGNHNTNIILGLTRAAVIEDATEEKNKRRAERTITAGKIIALSSLAAALIFFYYEFFALALGALILSTGGIALYRLGLCKKCRISDQRSLFIKDGKSIIRLFNNTLSAIRQKKHP